MTARRILALINCILIYNVLGFYDLKHFELVTEVCYTYSTTILEMKFNEAYVKLYLQLSKGSQRRFTLT